MDTQFKKGVVEVCVLNELKKEDTYGYKLVKSLSLVLEIGESTIYTMLRKLTNDGNLEVYEREGTDGPRRKYYSLTGIGNKRLLILIDEWELFSTKVNNLIGGLENE
ncbi:PadR family transcriptional regulator [Mycoplasmatota bacterium]|nr:PadR family transcriptional regulator [Mycoplasmatota bacterium]